MLTFYFICVSKWASLQDFKLIHLCILPDLPLCLYCSVIFLLFVCLLGLFFFLISALEECFITKPWWLLIGWWANWAFHMFIFIRKKDNFCCYCSAYVIDVLKVRIFFFYSFQVLWVYPLNRFGTGNGYWTVICASFIPCWFWDMSRFYFLILWAR